MLYNILTVVIGFSLFLSGCAEIKTPTAEKVMSSPWGTKEPVHLGDNKDYVRERWGEPDVVRQLGSDDTGLRREEWIYRGRIRALPVNGSGSGKTDRLTFTGDALTSWEKGEERVEKPDPMVTKQ